MYADDFLIKVLDASKLDSIYPYGVVLLGYFFACFFNRHITVLSRIPYFFASVISVYIYLIMMFLYMGILYIVAINAGSIISKIPIWLFVLPIYLFLFYFSFMFLLLAIARSRDAFGTGGYAFLVLLFYRKQRFYEEPLGEFAIKFSGAKTLISSLFIILVPILRIK